MWGKISQYHQDIEKWDLSPCVPRAGADCIPNTHHCSAGRYWWQTVSKDVQEFRLLTPFSVTVPYWTHFGECTCNFSFPISTFPFRKSAENSVYIYWKKTNKQKMARNFFFFLLFSIDAFWQGRKGGEWLCLYEIIISVVSSLQWPGPTEPAQLLLSM